MQTEIEEFLRKNFPNMYLASEVGDELKISRSSALRQLKKLVAKGRVVAKDGRYGSAEPKARPPDDPLQTLVQGLSGLTGIPVSAIEDWVEDVKARRRQAT